MSFLVRARARRLTPAYYLGTLVALAAFAAAAAAFTPMLATRIDPSGRRLALLDLDDEAQRLMFDLGLARTVAALLVGGALAAAGAAFQALLRNPLAEPFTLGVSSGSSLAAVIAVWLGFDSALGGYGLGLAALAGAAVTIALVWQLGRVGSNLPAATLLLAGITLTMFCSAATMLIQHISAFEDVAKMLQWMMGSLADVRWSHVRHAAIPILVGVAVLVALARELNALAGGMEAAASLGVATGRVQTILFLVASLVVGGCIALAGPIGFVGLMVPHALRMVIGPDHRLLVPASILAGATFLVLCDTAARLALPNNQLPVGVFTAILGGPFFVLLLVAQKRRGELWGPR